MIRWVAPSVETAEALIAGTLTWIVVEPDRPAVVAAASALGFGESTLPRWVDVAITDGLRIEIAHTCATCGGAGEAEVKPGLWFPCGPCGVPDDEVTEDNAFHNGSGLVVVGSVRPTAVLPVVDQDVECPDEPHVCVFKGRSAGQVVWQITYFDGRTEHDITDALSLYGDPASLVGRYAVEVTDARRDG